MTIRPSCRHPFSALVAIVAVLALATAWTTPALAQEDPADEPTGEGEDCEAAESDPDRSEGADSEDAPDPDEDTSPSDKGDGEADACESDPGPQQVSLANLVSPAPAAVDLELQAALTSVDFLDTWYSVTSTHPRLSLVSVTSPEADATRADLMGLIDELIINRETTTILLNASQDAVAQKRAVERAIQAVDEAIDRLESDRVDAVATRDELEAGLANVVRAIQNAVVGVYVSDTQTGVGGIDDVEGYNDRQELEVQVGATLDELLMQQDDFEAAIAEQDRIIDEIDDAIAAEETQRRGLEAQVESIENTLGRLTEQIAQFTGRRIEIEQGLPQHIGDTQRTRLLATAPVLNVSLVTLDAYVQAADAVDNYYPSCVVRWEILAGIARVESAHATFGGASVAANGDLSKKILGPLLDGTLEDTAVIRDTDGGALDGNNEYDAAVGPFQFIPGTWRSHDLDATGDGFADPHNLYDAALSAAGYLCASSTLGDDTAIARSVLSYNRSQKYLADVTGFARSYITSLALPQAAYDPATIDPSDGWGVHFEEPDPYAQLGQIAPVQVTGETDRLTNTGD